MAIYNYTDTAATKINGNLSLEQAKALIRFITKHGGEEASYSTIRHINDELRAMVVEAYTAIQNDAEHYLKYLKFDEPVEYTVQISQDDAESMRDELAEQKMVVDLEAANLNAELEDEIPF